VVSAKNSLKVAKDFVTYPIIVVVFDQTLAVKSVEVAHSVFRRWDDSSGRLA
jgi:hypothetical protein